MTLLLFYACDLDEELKPKEPAEKLTFQKMTLPFSYDAITISTAQILARLQGKKRGYILNEIKDITPKDVITISKKGEITLLNELKRLKHEKAAILNVKHPITITLNKMGTVTATLVLQHKDKKDAIVKATAERLTFQKVSKVFTSGGSFSTADILSGIQDTKSGYTVKSITNLNPSNLATVSASKELNFSGGVGSFTATIVLEHPTKADATITSAQFEITKATVPSLTWTKQSKTFSSRGEITNADLLAGLTGAGKSGYQIKTVNITNADGTGARVNGSGTSAKITSYTKVGTLTLDIVFEHNKKADATITGAQFEITKTTTAKTFTFNKITKGFATGGSFTTTDILLGVQGNKSGYTVKSITSLTPTGVVSVSGSGSNSSLAMIKAGNFTATIILEHATKADATITGAQFEITKITAERLTFRKVDKAFSSGGSFATAEILAGVQGNKSGYTVKSITSLTPTGVVSVSGSESNSSLAMIKAGNFTATIILEHTTKEDATITGAQFEITKATAERLTFRKVDKAFSSGGSFATAEILAGVRGNKSGYTVKSITSLTPTGVVSVSGSGSHLSLAMIKAGNFTATIILEHTTKEDATITGAQFEITKATAESFTFDKKTKNFATGGKFTTADILHGVLGNKTGYTVKNITNISPSNIVRFSSSKTLDFIGSVSSFTATIILEHPAKADATITGAQFEITKVTAERLTFQKIDKVFSRGGSFATAEILSRVQGTKTGYTIKSITAVSPNDVASPTGTAPAISINMAKQGNFTATIVLQHNTKADATITGAAFQIYSDLIQVSNDGKVTLKSGVDKTNITRMVIPTKINNIDVRAIGENAFYNCINLTGVTIPSSATAIGNSAFLNTNLMSVTIPSLVKSIGNSAFRDCISLSSVTIPSSVTAIGNSAFLNTKLSSVTILSSVTAIGNDVFRDCSSLSSVTIPSSVTAIGNDVFRDCSSLSSVTIPSSVTAIRNSAFRNCSSLSSITIPNSVTAIGESAFQNSKLSSVAIPNSVTALGGAAFRDCTSLSSITIPNSVRFMSTYVFYNCNSLTTIRVPTGKKLIGKLN